MNSEEKRNSVKRNYDLVARQYSKDFGIFIEDMDIYEAFERGTAKRSDHIRFGRRNRKDLCLF